MKGCASNSDDHPGFPDSFLMTSSTTSPHEYYTAGQMLPLRWLRLPLLLATFGLSIVTIAVGAQALDK